MSATQGMTPAVQKVINSLSADCRPKLADLYGKFRFDEVDLECFLMNQKGTQQLVADQVPAFQEFLEKERAKALQPKQPGRPSTVGEGGLKRKPVATAQSALLSEALASALGRPRPAAGVEELSATPAAKRSREAVESGEVIALAAARPPESAGRAVAAPLTVALKCSVNERNIARPLPGARGAARVELVGDSRLWTGSRSGTYAWMDEAPDSRAAARDARLVSLEADIVAAMQRRHVGEEMVVGTVGVPAQAEAVLCGRLVCEGLEGRLNERSILLEGSRASSMGARVQLSVAECQRLAAFPGQIVGVLGRSGMSGTTFHARDIIPGLPPTPSVAPSDASVHMLVLAGPFCLRDGLDYSPLERALEHAVAERPEVLVIIGPFLDVNNQKVASGDTSLLGLEGELCSFEEVYERLLLPLLQRSLAPLRRADPPTEVLIVPSLDEALCFHPMPQPPLDVGLGPAVESSGFEQLRRLGVRFLPNPAHVRVNGLTVSLTSADALSPVLREIVLRPEGKKIEEALRLLSYQRGLFPVVPRDPPQVSEARAAALDFPDGSPPDICVFPSASGTATGTLVDSTVFINPGTLCRPAALGSFAELWVAPAGTAGAGTALRERSRVDIHKIG